MMRDQALGVPGEFPPARCEGGGLLYQNPRVRADRLGLATGVLLLATVAATPFLGSWLGYRLNARLPRRAFALTLVVIALVGALRLLLS
ncbi:MAG TPA: hypothetical protein VFR53_02500 [Methylomirabilota bacterium]|nr:hypothetical protein [Methylomirabilota bacterium]